MKARRPRVGAHESAVVVTVGFMVAVGVVTFGLLGQGGGDPSIALDTLPADRFLSDAGTATRASAVEEDAGLRRLLSFTGVALGLSWLVGLAGLVILQLGRVTSRLKEYAVRSALGAGALRLLGQVLRDTSGALVAGALFGTGVGSVGLIGLRASWPHRLLGSPFALPGAGTMAMVIGVPIACGLLAVALPALGVWSRRSLSGSLGAAGVTPGRGAGVARLGLALGQVAATIALLMGAGALASGLEGPVVTAGDGVRSMAVTLPAGMSTERALELLGSRGLEEGGWSIAGRAALVGLGERTELANECGICVKGLIVTRLSSTDARTVPVGPSFFDTAGVPVLAGREFEAADRGGAPPVAIVNETFAREHFQDGDPLGRAVLLDVGFGTALEVVGVVADRPAGAIGLRNPLRPTLYLSALQYESTALEVVVGPQGPSDASLVGAVRAAGLLPTGPVRALSQRLEERFAPMDWLLRLILGVGAAGLVASVVGLYAVIGNLTRIRRRELALRLAVGAGRTHVSALVLRWTLGVVLAGLLLGTVAGSGVVTRIRVLVPGAPLADPFWLSAAWVLLFTAALLGAAGPLGRVLRLEPAEVLRDDRA